MSKISLAPAGNTMAPALAVLNKLGFVVSQDPSDSLLLQAENDLFRLRAEDILQLLGLASIAIHRGEEWTPTDAEIVAYLKLENRSDA